LDRIREFEADDIEQVANLHRDTFNLGPQPLERYHSYFSEQFLSGGGNSLSSLVYEGERGRILGFLGVAARHFAFGGRKITAAVSSQFVVHPEGRRRLTAVHLLREFFNGRQDLSFTDEASEPSQKIWVALGGSVSTLQGVHWIIPLRPLRLACQEYAPRWMAAVLGGTANILDRLVSSLPHSPFRNSVTALRGELLSAETMLTCLSEVTPDFQLRPHYEFGPLSEIIERAGRSTTDGSLRKVLLRDGEKRVAGWYLYHWEPGGLAEVLQIASRADCRADIVEHMASDARMQGATALVGRLEPGLAEPLANRFCLLFRRKYAMLVHSRFPEILSAIHSERAFISRLDGEWCLRFT
jgi:hypothetical protein